MGVRVRHRFVGIVGAALLVAIWAVTGSVVAANMTGPIDLGTVRTGTIDLNPSGSIQPAPPSAQPRRKPRPARAEAPLNIEAFFGTFQGSGLADGDDVAYFGVTDRDLDVRIGPAVDRGFTVQWTTVLREGGSPKAPKIRRRTATMTFAPGPNPGVYRAIENGDPLAGGIISWARISGHTLTIHQFTVTADGRHEIQTYARTLSGSGMSLVYTRVIDGERLRRVRGKLVKNGD